MGAGSVTTTDPRRAIPRTDVLLADPALAAAIPELGMPRVRAAVRAAQARARSGEIGPDEVAGSARSEIAHAREVPISLRRVLNATGVLVHTNLGRAPLTEAAIEAIRVAAGYVDVEFDVGTGARAQRGWGALDALMSAVPGAKAALVVNNGAAALALAASALAAGREVVVSRGELIEIGDGFRLPDLLESTGARLREVGTTNRTHLADYRAAVGPDTGFVLKVHPSNFRVTGFTRTVGCAELSHALSENEIPLVVDIGSGLLQSDPMLPEEPDAASTLADGADLVTASGDKLLGGPQAGIVLGRADLIEQLRRHPLARALRVDKLTLAALESTLTGPPTGVERALHTSADELHSRTIGFARALGDIDAEVVAATGAVGGGGAPGVPLPGWAVAIPETYAVPLRTGRPCVVARTHAGRCLIDLRCIDPVDEPALAARVREIAEGGS